jgi:hypothetical protein
MEALDANPDLAVIAHASAFVVIRDGQRTVEAEAGQLTGTATVVAAHPVWTGESQWSGGAYVQLAAGSQVTWALPAATQPRLVQAVINRVPGPGGVSVFTTPSGRMGRIQYGGAGAQGVSAAPGALLPITVPQPVPARADELTATTEPGTGQLDALLVTPFVSTLITHGDGHGMALLNSVADTQRRLTVNVPGTGPTVATSYDTRGQVSSVVAGTGSITVLIPAGGFAIALR